MKNFLPFALPLIENEEIDEVIDTLKSGWITTGSKTKLFEERFANYLGVKHALAVNSCTAALHLGLEAIGIKENDRVITTPFTFTATAEVLRYLGAHPLFIDINPKTFNINTDLISEVLENKHLNTDNIKAILPVHYAGQACEMDKILFLADKFNLKVIEDAAHAFPTTYNGKLIGNHGDIVCFSFYATKTITTGEGGMAVTQNDAFADRMKVMRLHGINRDVFNRYISEEADWYYEVIEAGYKYNLSDLASSIGIHQLEKAELLRKKREEIAILYNKYLSKIEEIITPYVRKFNDIHSWHLYVIQLKLEKLSVNRSEFIKLLKGKGVGTSVHFIPLHIHPYYRNKYGFSPDDFPIAYKIYKTIVSLPIYPKMSIDDVLFVIESIEDIIYKSRKKKLFNFQKE